MTKRLNILVIDPTAYPGGSKTATETILNLVAPEMVNITVLTSDEKSWLTPSYTRIKLHELNWLSSQEQGVLYFIRHLYIACYLLFFHLRLGHIDLAIGASGPGVDLPLYILKPVLKYKIIQLIHGPVAPSHTIAKCLKKADAIYYLESCKASLLNAISLDKTAPLKELSGNYHIFENGIAAEHWPSPCQYKSPIVFWAASLLKWKGLEIFVSAVSSLSVLKRPEAKICYIKARNTILPASAINPHLVKATWYEDPAHLDLIRASCNIFVSTSQNEPFGLSVLEAMASGHVVVIPSDGSYWDRILSDHVTSIKYKPNDPCDLAQKIQLLANDMQMMEKIGQKSFKLAKNYQAEQRYSKIIDYIEMLAKDANNGPKVSGESYV